MKPLDILYKFMHREFFYLPQNIADIFASCYPRFHISQEEASSHRCSHCHYIIRKESFKCCFFCQEFYHRSCAPPREKYFASRDNVLLKNPDIWVCEPCEPCYICSEAVGKNFFKCSICKNYLHEICGRLKGLEE